MAAITITLTRHVSPNIYPSSFELVLEVFHYEIDDIYLQPEILTEKKMADKALSAHLTVRTR
jgi:hypothetical protein